MSADLIEAPLNLDRLQANAPLTPAERRQAEELEREAQAAQTLLAIALVLGGAFLLYRAFAERRMRAMLPARPTSATMRAMSVLAWRGFKPTYVKITAPAIANAYAMGMVDARIGNVPPEVLQVLAMQYAREMGEYFNATSADALEQGFNSFVNRKLPARVAAEKVISAYGINVQQMRALVSAENLGQNKVTTVVEIRHGKKTERYVETQLITRARTFGENEAFTATRRGKQLTWMYLVEHDKLPKTATKVWVTAHDEKVCKSCGPMHKAEALVTEPFETPLGNVWVPSLHPNCRCDITLKTDVRELFGKAVASDFEEEEHRRDRLGRFTFKPKTLERTEVEEKTEEEVETPIWGAATGAWAPVSSWTGMEAFTPTEQQLEEQKLETQAWEAPSLAPPQMQAVTQPWAPPGLSAEAAEQAKIQAEALEAEIAAEAQAITDAIAGIQAAPETKAKTQPITATGTVSAWEMFRGQVYPTIEGKTHIEPGQTVEFTSANVFEQTPEVEAEYETQSALAAEVVEDLTREVMSKLRRPIIGESEAERITAIPSAQKPPSTTAYSVGIGGTDEEAGKMYTEAEVAEIIRAEMWGDTGKWELREIAQRVFDIHREDHAVIRTRLSESHRGGAMEAHDPRFGRIGWVVEGEYVVEDVKPMPETGWPIMTVFVAPKVKD